MPAHSADKRSCCQGVVWQHTGILPATPWPCGGPPSWVERVHTAARRASGSWPCCGAAPGSPLRGTGLWATSSMGAPSPTVCASTLASRRAQRPHAAWFHAAGTSAKHGKPRVPLRCPPMTNGGHAVVCRTNEKYAADTWPCAVRQSCGGWAHGRSSCRRRRRRTAARRTPPPASPPPPAQATSTR
jgi:hypothetical protein